MASYIKEEEDDDEKKKKMNKELLKQKKVNFIIYLLRITKKIRKEIFSG